MDAVQAAEIVDALPTELRKVDLAAVLGVTIGHLEKMKGLNRVPKFDSLNLWHRESIRPWLIERLINRDADLAAAGAAANKGRAMLGNKPKKLALHPLYPFLGIH